MISKLPFLFALSALCACDKQPPPTPPKAKFTYPARIQVVKPIADGPGVWQPLTDEFKKSSTLADQYPADWENMVRLVAVSALMNNKNCDNLDFLSPMALANHTAFRVGCIGKDGSYRTYVMARQVGSNGNFTMEYTK
jgi:hypothetical protein